MPKHKGKGKHRNQSADGEKRELTLKTEGLEYALAVKMLGAGRVSLQCFDNVQRIGEIRGSMRKKVWVEAGDILLVSLRDFQDGTADILLKYSFEEAKALRAGGHLPDITTTGEVANSTEGEITFQDDQIEDI
eukprot:GHVP01018860.1.p1 GENE.GHVP01018860.1~~GHVP01018860.1.p1  ORF type:complete len:133 (+),score=38.17 GHVP01018860.1:17-415(+)